MRYRVLASYQGAQYEAGIGPDDTGVVLFAACPPPEELHFEPATGHWRKRVGRADVQMLYESRPIGTFRGERCVVLDDLGDRLHIVYLGHDAFRAEQLGYWEVDRGVFELITPRQEVTEILELRLPHPLPGDGGPHSGPIPAINPANGYGPGATTGPYHTGPIPAVRPTFPNTGPIPAVRPNTPAGPIPPAGSIFPNTGNIPAVGPNPGAGPKAPGRPNSKLPAGRSGVSMPPADEAPLPLEAEAMRAATRRGKKAQPQPARVPQPAQVGPAATAVAQAQPPASAPIQAPATRPTQGPGTGPIQGPAAGPVQAPAATVVAPPDEALPADARTQATGPNQAPAQVPVGQPGQAASPGPADAAAVAPAAQPHAAGLSEPANAAHLDPEAASGVPSWTPQPPPQHAPIEPQPVHGPPAQEQASQAVSAAAPDLQRDLIPAGVAVVGDGSAPGRPEPTATVTAAAMAAAPPAAVRTEPTAASVPAPPVADPAQHPAPALPDAAQPSTSAAPQAQPVSAEAPRAEAAPQPQPAGSQQRPAAPVVGRRRRSTKRRLPTQRIFSDLATQAAIPASAYAIGEDVDGAMCLMRTDEGFEVFNSAAGARHEIRVFDDEESAYFYLFGVLVADAVRTGALAPRQ
jgi:hypothetical protein